MSVKLEDVLGDERYIPFLVDGKTYDVEASVLYEHEGERPFLLTVAKTTDSVNHGVPDKLHFFLNDYSAHDEYAKYLFSAEPIKLKEAIKKLSNFVPVSKVESELYYIIKEPDYYNSIPEVPDYFDTIKRKFMEYQQERELKDKYHKFIEAVKESGILPEIFNGYYLFQSNDFKKIADKTGEKSLTLKQAFKKLGVLLYSGDRYDYQTNSGQKRVCVRIPDKEL